MQLQRNKLLVNYDETCSEERLYVCLVNESSVLESEGQEYKMTNKSRHLLNDPRIRRSSGSSLEIKINVRKESLTYAIGCIIGWLVFG